MVRCTIVLMKDTMHTTQWEVASLNDWRIVDPPSEDKSLLPPCYENLLGACYAFRAAEQKGFRNRELTKYELNGLCEELFTRQDSTIELGSSGQVWANGFYFNSGVHRTVWVCERLLAILWCMVRQVVPSPDQKSPPFSTMRRVAEQCARDYPISEVAGIDAVQSSCKTAVDHIWKVKAGEKNILAVLRARVNIQKHATIGITYPDILVKKRNDAVKRWWGDLKSADQLHLALIAFAMVSQMYRDVHSLHTSGKLRLPI